MKRSDLVKFALIAIAFLWCTWYLVPTIRFIRLSPAEKERMDPYTLDRLKDKIIKLGLDLEGGMHLLLEVDKSKLTADEAKDAVDRAIEIIRNRVDQYGVAEPIIQKQGDNRIIVDLPGLQDKQRAKELIGKTALLEFILLEDSELERETIDKIDAYLSRGDLKDTTIKDTTVKDTAQTAVKDDKVKGPAALKNAKGKNKAVAKADTGKSKKDTLEDLSSMFGQEKRETTKTGEKTKPGMEEKPFSSLLVSLGGDVAVSEENLPKVKRLLADSAVQKLVPLRSQFLWASTPTPYNNKQYYQIYFLRKEAEMTGVYVADARVDIGSGADLQTANQPYVSLTLNAEGADIFDRVTGMNIKKRLAIVMDKKVHSAPVIQGRIPQGRAQITGRFSMQEAQDLAIILRSGALPAPVNAIEERTVGPSLGEDSIHSGILAALAGTLLVILFMIFYYRWSGLLAVITMFLNIYMLMAVMAGLHATLTMPGIAGIILTIGMAVDVNVLILERVREELRLGKTIRSALDTGYARAFNTIIDTHVTTIITAVVLYQFGTGPIKGFAITLIVGLLLNLFTSVMGSKVAYDFITVKYNLKRLSI